MTDNPVTRQALLDDPWWERCGNRPEFLPRPASPFLSFRDQHEVLRWLHIQLGTLLVADHYGFFAAALAYTLTRCARQNPLHARKIRRQFLAARMFARSLRPAMHWRVLTLRLLDHFTDDG